MSEHPRSWARVPVRDLMEILADGKLVHQGWSPQCESGPAVGDGDWGALKTTAIQDGAFFPEHNKRLPDSLDPRSRLEVHAGDVLLTCAGPRARCGVACLVRSTPPRLFISGKMYRFRANTGLVDPRYLEAFLRTPETKAQIDAMKTGISESGMNITHERFAQLVVPLAPMREQQRIVEKLDTALARVDACRDRLTRVAPLLKRFRQSVLAAATSGRLTEDWRGAERPTSARAASQLEKIANDRLRSMKRAKDPVERLRTEEFEIPASWIWTSLDTLTAKIVDGTHHTPTYVEQGVPFVSVKDIRDGSVDFSNTKFISVEEHVELSKRCPVERGDLLITKSGTIGRTAIVATDIPFSLFVSVALLKPASHDVNMQFIDTVLQNWVASIDVASRIVGSTIKNLHLVDMKVLAIPFPSLEEQTEIVRRVEALFAFADRLEARLAQAQTAVDRLTPSLLAKAFRGELVPQEPEDEPAAELLKRLPVERAAAPPRGRKARQSQPA